MDGGGVVTDLPDVPDASAVIDGGPRISECEGGQEFGSCSRDNALSACVESRCVLVECVGDFVDCDGEADNGCEATLDSLEHCGLCGAACALPNAKTLCNGGQCELLDCVAGFGDCDDNPNNGCETRLDTIANCGQCGNVCPVPPNGAPGCNDGQCGVSQCGVGFADCDPETEGCEQTLDTLVHCGGCNLACEPPSADGSCDTGACVIDQCLGGAVDCNGLPRDGCEASLQSVAHCGACGARCELPRATRYRCEATGGGTCVVEHACDAGDTDCEEGALENGCEDGWADCDEDSANGCERNLSTLNHCGGCGVRCEFENGIGDCSSGSCEFVGCLPGYDQCGGSTCTSLADDPDNCGACGNVCDGATPRCYGGRCTSASCTAGTADCDGDVVTNGCETDLDRRATCGLCDVSCGPYPHADAGCDTSGSCTIAACDAGWEDCDGVVSNGCEVDIRTLDACGGCDTSCAIPFASESCASGSCELTQCNGGRDDCDGAPGNGCETDLSLPTSCGECDNDCTGGDNVLSAGCDDGACEIICAADYSDCNGDLGDGCEARLGTETACTACGDDCTMLPHVASATCGAGGCQDLVCEDGWADCDGVPGNGCERSVRTLDDCGACDQVCAPDRGTGDCSSGTCEVVTCDSGFADCNDDGSDGCESSLAAPGSCGSCDNQCGDGATCENGECTCTDSSQCGEGEECCDGNCVNTQSSCSWAPCIPGLEPRDLLHCGGCNMYCPAALGMFFCCALP
jgi:hypothetical protein